MSTEILRRSVVKEGTSGNIPALLFILIFSSILSGSKHHRAHTDHTNSSFFTKCDRQVEGLETRDLRELQPPLGGTGLRSTNPKKKNRRRDITSKRRNKHERHLPPIPSPICSEPYPHPTVSLTCFLFFLCQLQRVREASTILRPRPTQPRVYNYYHDVLLQGVQLFLNDDDKMASKYVLPFSRR